MSLNYTQSRLASFLEAFLAASIAAPSAIALNDFMLSVFGNDLSQIDLKNTFLLINWFLFFVHSMVWKYILRRLFVKYGFRTEPRYLCKLIKTKVCHS